MESTPEQAAEGRALVAVLACVLEKLIQANANSGVREAGRSTCVVVVVVVLFFIFLSIVGFCFPSFRGKRSTAV